MKTNIVLGISAYYHDSAAALLKNGRIIAAVQEERFTRIKGDSSFPHNAINYCLNECGISIEDVGICISPISADTSTVEFIFMSKPNFMPTSSALTEYVMFIVDIKLSSMKIRSKNSKDYW